MNHDYYNSGAKHFGARNRIIKQCQTLSAMDVLAPTPMKNAVKCDTSCELQNQWVIKTLNATCTSFGEYVCWSVCSSPPSPTPLKQGSGAGCRPPLSWKARADEKTNLIIDPFRCNTGRTRDDIITRLDSATLSWLGSRLFSIRTSNQSRIPAEFKHITRRRKRN